MSLARRAPAITWLSLLYSTCQLLLKLDKELAGTEEQWELLQELISNSKQNEGYLTLARDLNVMEPKTPDDIYKLCWLKSVLVQQLLGKSCAGELVGICRGNECLCRWNGAQGLTSFVILCPYTSSQSWLQNMLFSFLGHLGICIMDICCWGCCAGTPDSGCASAGSICRFCQAKFDCHFCQCR
jgi:hypothetical protein